MATGPVSRGHKPVPDPTPSEIRQRCVAIQSEWDDEERERRRLGWTAPVVLLVPRARWCRPRADDDLMDIL